MDEDDSFEARSRRTAAQIRQELQEDMERIERERTQIVQRSFLWARHAKWPLLCSGTFEVALGASFVAKGAWSALPCLALGVWCLVFFAVLLERFR